MLSRVDQIRAVLDQAFSPTHLAVEDDSHLHAGHVGAQSGKGHFSVEIISSAFSDQPLLVRHRMIYSALSNLMATDIHALRISARSPEESPGE